MKNQYNRIFWDRIESQVRALSHWPFYMAIECGIMAIFFIVISLTVNNRFWVPAVVSAMLVLVALAFYAEAKCNARYLIEDIEFGLKWHQFDE